MMITKWNLEDNINTKEDLFNYMQAAIEENDFEYFIIACRDVIKIARLKGFYTEEDRHRLWYKQNKDRLNKLSREWHKAHIEQDKEYQKQYRKKNAEKCKKLQAEWRKNNKDKRKAYFRNWYLKKHNITETRPYNKRAER